MTARLAALLALLLAGCATAPSTPVPGEAVVDATPTFSAWFEQGNQVTVDRIDGKPTGTAETHFVLAPGPHQFQASCTAHDDAGDAFFGHASLDTLLEAGHRYTFITEDPTKRSAAETLWVVGHSAPLKQPSQLEGFLMSMTDDCAPFLYDSTGDASPYPEQVTVSLPDPARSWKPVKDDRRAGHWLTEEIPSDEDAAQGSTLLSTEYWSRLMYRTSADEIFKARVQEMKKTCPDAQVSVGSETQDAVDYEFDTPGCAANPVQAELGRFITGRYAMHRVTLMFRHPLQASDRDAWSKALAAANLTTF